VLFTAELTAGSRLGCLLSNIMRYYFIMVSLLWNGAEAYNMRLMLIKVFDQLDDHFVLKAAGISWGINACQ
jgi:hypothetical protein